MVTELGKNATVHNNLSFITIYQNTMKQIIVTIVLFRLTLL